MVGYSSIMFVVMNYVSSRSPMIPIYWPKYHSSPQFIAAGVHLLIFGEVRNTTAYCAVLFMSFSSVKIIQATLDFGKERHASSSGSTADTPRLQRKIKLDASETLVLEFQQSPYSETMMGTPHWPIVNSFLLEHPRFRSFYEVLFPAISVRGYAVETVVLVVTFCCALSGMSQGVTGAGGPPRIVAYSVLDISKGSIRGLTSIGLVSNLSLLYVDALYD
jgi:hypothetical protein